ncbi:MAG: hypothetical protein J6E46_13360 [Faecalicoccus sp.]|nr:hypothetical protein [Faecalicoccus sp.]
MRLYSSDEKISVDVGTGSIWYSIYSTAMTMISDKERQEIPLAMEFLKTGECPAEHVKETCSQLKTVVDIFSKIPPEKAIYDYRKPNIAPPWKGNIATAVTSCANLHTTADGKDLFTEVFKLFDYAEKNKVSILAG